MNGLMGKRESVETVNGVENLQRAMADWLADRARASPGATALIEADSGERLSYADLDERVEALAAGLARVGIGRGDHVGIVLEVEPRTVALVHAVARRGAVLVTLSGRLTAGELETRVRRADCEVLVYGDSAEVAAGAIEEDTQVLPVDRLDRMGGDAIEGQEIDPIGRGERTGDGVTNAGDGATGNGPAGSESVGLEEPLVVLFTSGTTGHPKAVVLTAGNVLASAAGSAVRLGTLPDDRWLVALSPSGMGGLAPIYRTVLYGSALVLRREFDARGTLETLSERNCTLISLVPTMLSRMVDVVESGEGGEDREDSGREEKGFPDSLRCVLLGGAPASLELIERCRVANVPIYPTYGMTETASQVATARPEETFSEPGTVGRPLLGTQVQVVENGAPLVAGKRGELVISGPTVTPGYYDDPEANEEAFSEAGFHTGDIGYVDSDGRVWVTGRLDDRILTGGQTVDPREVSDVLRKHPAIREAAIVGLASEQWGQEVGAALVAERNTGSAASEVDESEIEAFCRERLANYKLPRTIAVVDRLPRTVSGTVDRVALRDRLREGGD
jgi:O-succinylbenzoic acid--CoA ligase